MYVQLTIFLLSQKNELDLARSELVDFQARLMQDFEVCGCDRGVLCVCDGVCEVMACVCTPPFSTSPLHLV